MLGRVLAAVSYIGLGAVLAPLAQPGNPFVVRHGRQALLIHLLRVALLLPAFVLPFVPLYNQFSPGTLTRIAASLSLLVFLGIPAATPPGFDGFWIRGVLWLTWSCDLFGVLLALAGHTADWHAFFNANWPNRAAEPATRTPPGTRAAHRAWLVRLRERRLARIRAADAVAVRERRRRDLLTALRAERATIVARQAHLRRLLELGEISERRFTEQAGQLDSRLAAIGTEIALHDARRVHPEQIERSLPPALPAVVSEAPLQALAISARGGVPLFTYGAFQLDEALVTGVLTAFDSVSEEVFGTQIHKTQLAEGQVLSFVHARYTVTIAVFTDEPAPAQLGLLQGLVEEFEQVNAGELRRSAPDPARLREVRLPFTFTTTPATT